LLLHTALRGFSKGEALVELANVGDSLKRATFSYSGCKGVFIIILILLARFGNYIGGSHTFALCRFFVSAGCIRILFSIVLITYHHHHKSVAASKIAIETMSTRTLLYIFLSLCAKLGCKQVTLADRITSSYILMN
jgi:hypothetical protein